MASYTWNNGAGIGNRTWADPANWCGAGPPGANDTVMFGNVEGAADGSRLPSTGPGVALVVHIAGAYTGTRALSDFILSGASATTLSLYGLFAATLNVDLPVSTLTNTDRPYSLNLAVAHAGAVQATGGATVNIAENVTVTGGITLTGGSDLSIAAAKTLTGNVTMGTGSVISAGGAGAAIIGVVTASASGAAIVWTNLTITGNIAAAGYDITHGGTGGTLTLNAAATLDAGTATAGPFAVNITHAAGTVVISKLLTTGAVTFNATGTGNITLPAAIQTGAFTVTNVAGTLTCAASPGTTVTAGGTVLGQAIGILTNPLNLTLTGTDNLSWNLAGVKAITTLTANGTTTLNGTVLLKALAGTGDIALGTRSLYFHLSSANFWTYAPTGTGMTGTTGIVYLLYLTIANRANAQSIDAGSAQVWIYPATNDVTLSVAGDFKTTGALQLRSNTAEKASGLDVAGDFQAGAITLGTAAGTDVGKLTLAAGYSHSFTSVTRAAANTGTTHEVNANGNVVVSGDITLAGIAATANGATVVCAGTFTVGTGGSLTVGASGMTITGSPSITGNGTLSATGPLTVSGALTLNTTGNVTFPAAVSTGDFTVTAVGTLTCNAAGTTLTASGNVTGTAITTLTNPLNLTMTGASKTLAWDLYDTPIDLLTITGTVLHNTPGNVVAKRYAGAGTLTLSSACLLLRPETDNFWTATNPIVEGVLHGDVYIIPMADVENAALIAIAPTGSTPLDVGGLTTTHTLKATGGISCFTMFVNSAEGATAPTLDMNGGNLSCMRLEVSGESGPGVSIVKLGTGSHTLGEIRSSWGGDCQLFFESSRCTVLDDVTCADIAVHFGSARITAGGNVTVDGADATSVNNDDADLFGKASNLTVKNVNNGGAKALRVWGADVAASTGNVNVQVRPDVPGGGMLLGLAA